MTTPPEAQVMKWPALREFGRRHVVRGSAILLMSTGLVAATNLFYNILIARMLGASGFGHASALYTLLMVVTAVTLSFQIVTSKFIARNSDAIMRAEIYSTLLRRAWLVGFSVAISIVIFSAYLESYLNLPSQRDLVLLALAAGIYIPLGVQRGRMQGGYNFAGLAINVVAEVAVKVMAAVLLLRLGMGVTGVMVAVLLSIVAAYFVGQPGAEYRGHSGRVKIAPFGEGMQAVLYFIGQVVLSNLDILLVKHFFSAVEAGVYAAVALVGRVVFMLSWSVVSSMFPVSASHAQKDTGHSVLRTALFLVGSVTSLFVIAVALAPQRLWTMLLGQQFLAGEIAPFSSLVTEYAVMTGIYCIAVVVMMYEISRRIGTAAWVQLVASIALAGTIWFYHHSLSQVILVQVVVMTVLLACVSIPLLRERKEPAPPAELLDPVRLRRPVSEDEIVAEFLRGEFYHAEYDPYRQDFEHIVEHGDLENAQENFIRRALLFRRRGGLWRELPPDTKWWEVELAAGDFTRLRSFPRNEWRRFAGGAFSLLEMVGRCEDDLKRGEQTALLSKLSLIAGDLREKDVPDGVLLIGIDRYQELTIIEGNHRMAAAMLTMPESAHTRFRFYCGLSPDMNSCCWHRTDVRSVSRFLRHTVRNMFHDADFYTPQTLREKLTRIETR